MMVSSIYFLSLFNFDFKLGHKAADAARWIREVLGHEAISKRIAQNSFQDFMDGDHHLFRSR